MFGAFLSNNRPKPSQSWKHAMIERGFCSRRIPKMVGKIPPEPTPVGAISNLLVSQSFEVTPCCSGPAPMIIDAQFGLLDVGITPRACRVHAPLRRSESMLGVRA